MRIKYWKLFHQCIVSLLFCIRKNLYDCIKSSHFFHTISIRYSVEWHQVIGDIVSNKDEQPTWSNHKTENWHPNWICGTTADKLWQPCRRISKRCPPIERKSYLVKKWKLQIQLISCVLELLWVCVLWLTQLETSNKMNRCPSQNSNNWQWWTIGWRMSLTKMCWISQNRIVYKTARFSQAILYMRPRSAFLL